MKKSLTFIVCSLFSLPLLSADWKEIVSNEYYVDLERLTNEYMWIKQIHSPPKEDEHLGKLVYSRLMKIKYACNSNSIALTHIYSYDSKGNVINSASDEYARLKEVAPDTIGDFYLKTACNLKSSGYARNNSVKNNDEQTVGSHSKMCNQILKDTFYYRSMSSICYNKKDISVDGFIRQYVSNSCGEPNDSMFKNAESSVSNAITKKALKEGIEKFCEEEKGYYNKVKIKYSGRSL